MHFVGRKRANDMKTLHTAHHFLLQTQPSPIEKMVEPSPLGVSVHQNIVLGNEVQNTFSESHLSGLKPLWWQTRITYDINKLNYRPDTWFHAIQLFCQLLDICMDWVPTLPDPHQCIRSWKTSSTWQNLSIFLPTNGPKVNKNPNTHTQFPFLNRLNRLAIHPELLIIHLP